MPEIDSYADVLDGPQRRVWTKAAEMSAGVSGVLMGGTAVAMHLRHRRSDDLDIMTLSEFSGAAVARRLSRAFRDVEVIEAAENCCAAIVDSVRIEFFRALPSGEVGPAQMRRVAEGPDICGMPIGSLPDLLATKLDVAAVSFPLLFAALTGRSSHGLAPYGPRSLAYSHGLEQGRTGLQAEGSV